MGLDAGKAQSVDDVLTYEVLSQVADANLFYLKGNAKLSLSLYEDAVFFYKEAIDLSPNWDAPHNNMGVCFERLGKKEEALRSYQMAVRLAPQSQRAAVNAAKIAFGLGQRQAAFELLKDFENGQGDADVIAKMAYVSYYIGNRKLAEQYARHALRIKPWSIGAIVQKVVSKIPVVYRSSEEVDQVAQSVDEALREMRQDCERACEYGSEKLVAEFSDIWADPLFYLTYNGRLNKTAISVFNDNLAMLVRTAFGECEHSARESRTLRQGAAKKRVAIVSAFVCSHSIWKIPLAGIYADLDRSKYEIFTFHLGGSGDEVTEIARKKSDYFMHELALSKVLPAIAQAGPDVVIFPDVGMNFASYCATGLRFAPLQLQMLGHPETSGSACVDLVLSPDTMEQPCAQEFYREQLIRLPGLGCAYVFNYPKPDVLSRADFGLSDNDVIFVSPQSIFKYVPDDDEIYPKIALRVGSNCRFVFLRPKFDGNSASIFEARLCRAFGTYGLDYKAFVTFIDAPLATPRFMALCGLSDVFLDNVSWSGHNTTLDALHCGTLVLCAEGTFMRQSHSAAIMRCLGFPELVAKSRDELIDLCAKYAIDSRYREEYRASLPSRMMMLQETDSIRALENVLETEREVFE
ncbi:hypothetical protein [Burkholderia ubonensis]|uniref:O-linked N-acetylglucosamine transferase family protein n=1 Tax=Burkholderia ubonensis TaxID=101571 RepID=UPI0018DF8078|nr:hypothetical protein [Burkholderia ubonensis]